MIKDVQRTGNNWIQTDDTYITGETADGQPTLLSNKMLDTWKAWDSFGQVPQTFSADWAITLGLNATFMKKWGYTLDVHTMVWYQDEGNGLGNTSYGSSSNIGSTGGAYKFTIEDWESGYRPYSVNVQHAINLGITDDWMRENGYTLAGGIWVKGAGSGGSGNNEGGGNNGGYSGYYQQPSPINRRVSTG
jgi:hypothetical protein